MVGMGGLGCPAAMYLAAAGVGHLTLIDADVVSVTNLHREVLYGPDEVGQSKVAAAREALVWIAPHISIEQMRVRLDASNAEALLGGHDVIVDGTDTWWARYAVADAAANLDIPVAWGAVQGWNGQVTVFDSTVSLRDVFPTEPEASFDTCENGAVLGSLCGQVGAAMATEAIKLLTGIGESLAGRISVVDARSGRWREIPLQVNRVRVSDTVDVMRMTS
jgi:adenylyltransferase/sulfurtransferase